MRKSWFRDKIEGAGRAQFARALCDDDSITPVVCRREKPRASEPALQHDAVAVPRHPIRFHSGCPLG
jgi:hypothetical protein